jgi:hypothetical protein
MYKSFCEKHSFSDRIDIAKKLIEKDRDKIPIVCEPYDKNNPLFGPTKHMIGKNKSLAELLIFIREKMNLKSDQPIYLYVNDELIDLHVTIQNLYAQYKNEDLFLYIKYDQFKRSKNLKPSLFSFLSDYEKIFLSEDKKKQMFDVIKTNWYYKQESRILFLDSSNLFRLVKTSVSNEYEIHAKIPYKDIDVIKLCNDQLIISYKYNTGISDEYYSSYLNSDLKDLNAKLLEKIRINLE